MTTIEITNRINELERLSFCLSMKDRWSTEDFDTNRKWNDELLELKKMLERG